MNIELTKNHPLTKDLYWLSAPIAKTNGEVRDHLTHLYLKNGKMYATDGKRLHCICKDLPDWKDGFYKIAKRTKTNVVLMYMGDENYSTYPDCDFLLEKPSGTSFDVVMHEKNSSKAMAQIIRKMEDGSINYNYLDDVLSDENVYSVSINTHEHPIYFESENKIAIIMPIKI